MIDKNLAKIKTDVKSIEKKGLSDVKRLEKFIEIEQAKRNLLKKYISDNLVEGIDYGVIEIESKRTGQKYKSKPTLFKAGSEKFISLMHLRPIFKRDDETWEMTGKKAGLFCYICQLINIKGEVVGEGRGSCDISEKKSANEAIKLAEKRAQLDATLRTGGLSDFFTQDLEDMPDAKIIKKPALITGRQLTMIYTLLPTRGKTKEDICYAYKVNSIEELTVRQASNIINRLLKMPPVKNKTADVLSDTPKEPATDQETIDLDEVDRGIAEMEKKNPEITS
jgi:hypothetical protein